MSKKISFDPKNFNKHSNEGMDLLEKSIKEVGAIESIAIDKNGAIITGNARKQTFDKLGYKPKFIKLENDEYPVIETDLDGEQRVKAAILANTVAKKNINLDTELIREVAVEEFCIDVEELGVNLPEEDDDEDNSPRSFTPTFKFIVTCQTDKDRKKIMGELLTRGYACETE